MAENTEAAKEPKKIKWWGWLICGFVAWLGWLICGFVVLLIVLGISNTDTSQNTPTKKQTETKVDVTQQRIDRITELMTAEIPEFEKVERFEDNALGIYFSSMPDLGIEDTIDSTTRGQARNLSNDLNGVASVKTFVGGEAQMFCTATKGQVNDCIDYR